MNQGFLKLAKSMLCVPATSTAAERIFPETLYQKKKLLKATKRKQNTFLNKNFIYSMSDV